MESETLDSSTHLLVVDDDREICDLLSRFMKKHGYRVETARSGKEMRQALDTWRIDLVILDRMLPGEDGLGLCRQLRADSRIPIIMLTVMGDETDRIVGLEIGADDYISKPFNPHELLARIKAVLRRTRDLSGQKDRDRKDIFEFSGWKLNQIRRQLETPEGVILALSDGEFDLLVVFAERPQRILSREQLLDLSRGRAAIPFDRSIDVQIGRLRRKIEVDPKHPQIIKTVRGGGYLFTLAVVRI